MAQQVLFYTLIFSIPPLFFALFYANPKATRAVIAELKRRWRLYFIKKYGQRWFSEFAEDFKKQAVKKGYDKSLAEDILKEHKTEIVERLGTKVANQRLGEPSSLERYF